MEIWRHRGDQSIHEAVLIDMRPELLFDVWSGTDLRGIKLFMPVWPTAANESKMRRQVLSGRIRVSRDVQRPLFERNAA
jgi:hypothetical protein